jgi:hypothetical protein
VNQPIIQSVGLPPEKHADRVIAEMLRVIAQQQPPLITRLKQIVKTMPDGNPSAQQKIKNKLEEIGGLLIPDVFLIPGKRGRFTIDLTTIAAWNSECQDYIREATDCIPDKPWLACLIVRYQSKGHHRYETSTAKVLLVTHHALSRLAQRYGAQTVNDLLIATDAMLYAFLRDIKIHGNKPEWIKDEYPLHFKLENANGFISHITAIIKPCEDDDGGAVAVTII